MRRALFAMTAVASLLSSAIAEAEEPACYLPATIERVKDGDTLVMDIHLPLGLLYDDQTVRCLGYDAWESTKRRRSVNVTDEEIQKGRKAKQYLQSLIDQSSGAYIRIGYGDNPQRDPYGRLLGRVYLWQQNCHSGHLLDVAQRMKSRGHVRE